MSRARISWRALMLLTAVVYVVLVSLGQTHLDTGDGQQPFDMRIMGYDGDAARAYLDALHPFQIAFYQGPLRLLDTVFPVLFGALLFFSARGLGMRPAWLPAACALYAPADLIENVLISRLLSFQGGGVPDDLARLASLTTQTKFGLAAVAMLLIGRAGLKKWRGA